MRQRRAFDTQQAVETLITSLKDKRFSSAGIPQDPVAQSLQRPQKKLGLSKDAK